MPVTPRSRTASASGSPSKANGRRQSGCISINLSEDEEPEVKKTRGRPSKAKETIEVIDDDDDDDDDEEAGDEYEVEIVRNHRPHKGPESWDMEYYIKWKGWPEADNTWEPETNLPQNLIDDYWKKQPSKSQPKKFEQVGKRKAQDGDDEDDEDDIEEIQEDSEEEERSPIGKAKNGRRASAAATKHSSPAKSTPKRGGANKRARTSTSSRRRASSDEEEEEEEEEEDAVSIDAEETAKAARAMKKISDRFLEHYMKKEDWEDQVRAVRNMQRNADSSQLESEVEFKESPAWTRAMEQINQQHKFVGRGPSIWIPNEIVNERCPQKVIKFYEEHVRFSNPRPAH